jgi:PadR family transcriptional regulator, regulatory protein PadR
MAQAKPEFLKRAVDLLLLKVVALLPDSRLRHLPAHSANLQGLFPGATRDPALHRLENRGWLGAGWRSTDTGREAKFYSLTKKGRKHLEAEMASWERMSDAVALILRTAG